MSPIKIRPCVRGTTRRVVTGVQKLHVHATGAVRVASNNGKDPKKSLGGLAPPKKCQGFCYVMHNIPFVFVILQLNHFFEE